MKRLAIAAAFVLAACTTGSGLNREGLELVEAGQFEEGIARLEAATPLSRTTTATASTCMRGRERSSDRILRSAEQRASPAAR